MADENAVFAIESNDCLENRLNIASPEQSRQLLEEFWIAFCRDTLAHPELEKVTITGHMAE